MRIAFLAYASAFVTHSACLAQSTTGIEGLIRRRLPAYEGDFSFAISGDAPQRPVNSIIDQPNDQYTISNGEKKGTIHISGNTPSALAYGLRDYLSTYLNVDIYWFIGSTLDLAAGTLPPVESSYNGSSIVPWRYHFNTVTFSYTAAFWSWEDWELQLDWMALHGINLPLAWVGYEKILVDVLLEHNLTEAGIANFLSGPAFQAWNRFGNIQGSWGGNLPISWINSQSELQKKIVDRMVELGMTPVLPSFTGFVPREAFDVLPGAALVNGSQWSGFPLRYTNVTFLEPFDPLFARMQESFIKRQRTLLGNVSHIYTLDQYNENDPYSGQLDYLRNVTKNTIKALKAADADAIWMLQGWLFYSASDFWTNDRIEAYLGGVDDTDMIILDLFSESEPQWQRTNSYYGKPWIWCMLHDYGGNMGLYGQVENVTVNPVAALSNTTSTMVGMGLTMEGEEGNEIMYDLVLDQAWFEEPLNVHRYFRQWAEARYHGEGLPPCIHKAWKLLSESVYNNTNLTLASAVTKSIFVLSPNTTGIQDVVGHHSTAIAYSPDVLVQAWQHFYHASNDCPALWNNAAYAFDLTDITRQVLANAFHPQYDDFLAAANRSLGSYDESIAKTKGQQMTDLLSDVDTLLSASGEPHFSLANWVNSARSWASAFLNASNSSYEDLANFYEYDARNQVTLWGPHGEISDYASKQWAGLISSYYVPRWEMFVEFTLNSTTSAAGVNSGLRAALLAFEETWQHDNAGDAETVPGAQGLAGTIQQLVQKWPGVFYPSVSR